MPRGIEVFLSTVTNILDVFLLSVTFDTDCFSSDCSHVNCHVGVVCGILVHTFVVDLAHLFNVQREDVLQGHSKDGHIILVRRCTEAHRNAR